MVRVKLSLVGNVKALYKKPFFARVDLESGRLEFLRPLVGEWRRGVLAGGEWEVDEEEYYIARGDWSTHRHTRLTYTLFRGAEKVAEISVEDGNVSFSDEATKECYIKARTRGGGSPYIIALVERAKIDFLQRTVDVRRLVEEKIKAYAERIARQYGVKVKVHVEVEEE